MVEQKSLWKSPKFLQLRSRYINILADQIRCADLEKVESILVGGCILGWTGSIEVNKSRGFSQWTTATNQKSQKRLLTALHNTECDLNHIVTFQILQINQHIVSNKWFDCAGLMLNNLNKDTDFYW